MLYHNFNNITMGLLRLTQSEVLTIFRWSVLHSFNPKISSLVGRSWKRKFEYTVFEEFMITNRINSKRLDQEMRIFILKKQHLYQVGAHLRINFLRNNSWETTKLFKKIFVPRQNASILNPKMIFPGLKSDCSVLWQKVT
jgi:hypothetical protein